jgi:membrane associated rhomboid family serine protease
VSLNHIFLFLAIVSPLLVLARAWRPGTPYEGWRIAGVVVLTITAVAWIRWPSVAGYIGGCAWFLLLFVPAIGLRKMNQLAAQRRYKEARNLAAALQILHPSAQLREQLRLLHRLEIRRANGAGQAHIAPARQHRQLARAPAVLIFILLNAAVFVLQISMGDPSDPEILHRIGALEPYPVIVQGQYWRFFTALFLHGGALHLLFNLFALYVLGPPLERAIGGMRFTACYLFSGLASGAGVVLLTASGLMQVDQLIGASGCILGVVGAWAGFLLRYRHAPMARQRLANVLLIVTLQVAFDLSTPQVSMAAHICGLIAGFFLGLALTGRLGSPALSRSETDNR